MWVAFAVRAKATHIFSAKKFRILYIESTKTVNEMTFNELIKLTTIWTTGPSTLGTYFFPVYDNPASWISGRVLVLCDNDQICIEMQGLSRSSISDTFNTNNAFPLKKSNSAKVPITVPDKPRFPIKKCWHFSYFSVKTYAVVFIRSTSMRRFWWVPNTYIFTKN